jgi:hypothetical protein
MPLSYYENKGGVYDDDYQKPCLKILQFTEMKRQDPNSYRSIRELQQRDLSLMKSFWRYSRDRIWVKAASKETIRKGEREYCYIGIRLKTNFQNN